MLDTQHTCKRLLCVITCAGFSIRVESDIQLARIFCTEVARWPQQRRSLSLRELKLMDKLSTCRQLFQVTRMCKLQSALSLIKWKWEVNSNNAKHVYANDVDTWSWFGIEWLKKVHEFSCSCSSQSICHVSVLDDRREENAAILNNFHLRNASGQLANLVC